MTGTPREATGLDPTMTAAPDWLGVYRANIVAKPTKRVVHAQIECAAARMLNGELAYHDVVHGLGEVVEGGADYVRDRLAHHGVVDPGVAPEANGAAAASPGVNGGADHVVQKPLRDTATADACSDAPSTSSSQPYADHARQLIVRGYGVTPVIPGTKKPGYWLTGRWIEMPGWQKLLLERAPTSDEIEIWGRRGAGLNVVCGPSSKGLVGYDIDTDDPDIQAALLAIVPEHTRCPAKRGQKGLTLFFYGPKAQTRPWRIGKKVVAELLVAGRNSVLPPTIHPDTKSPYIWLPDRPRLDEVSPGDLPELASNIATLITEALIPFGYGKSEDASGTHSGVKPNNKTPVGAVPGSAFQRLNHAVYANTPYGKVNALAMSRLDDWVPHVGLVGYRKTPNRHEAVASWRPSNDPSLPDAKRGRALSITPEGCKDFADPHVDGGKGYTPIDLVMVVRNLDQVEAFKWFCDRLGVERAADSDLPPGDEIHAVPAVPLVPAYEINGLRGTGVEPEAVPLVPGGVPGAGDAGDDGTQVGVEPLEPVEPAENGVGDAGAAQSDDDDVGGSDQPGADETGQKVGGKSASEVRVIPLASRPCFRVFKRRVVVKSGADDQGQSIKPGVWHFSISAKKKGDDGKAVGEQHWISTPLWVTGQAFDERGDKAGVEFGRTLEFINTLGRAGKWTMPMELLGGDNTEIRAVLLSKGVLISQTPYGRALFAQYLQQVVPKKRVRCSSQIGWYGLSPDLPDLFVLPDVTVGTGGDSVVFQTAERLSNQFTSAGSLAQWQQTISDWAVGNCTLTVSICAGFAGCLIVKTNAESGGIHWDGQSSMGKTVLLEASASIWGGRGFVRTWRTTANGMEGAATLSNDCLLPLDEINECEPRHIGSIAYALGNGIGKQRASREGRARSVHRWRTFVLSSGEKTLADAMLAGGIVAQAGQEVRLLNIPAERAHGVWDDLHGFADGAAFTDAIRSASRTYYGVAGRAFLEGLTGETANLREALEAIKEKFRPLVKGGQDERAAGRLALCALAGVLASKYGVVNWPEGTSINAAIEVFKAWQSRRGGGGNLEPRKICDAILDFVNAHSESRFSEMGMTPERLINNRAGWWKDASIGREYYFTSGGMHEALKDFGFDGALRVLIEVGALAKPDDSGRKTQTIRVLGRKTRVYVVNHDKLVPEDDTAKEASPPPPGADEW
jgi:putative DNA primase/helicase